MHPSVTTLLASMLAATDQLRGVPAMARVMKKLDGGNEV
jgi:hypothetical protein